MIKIAIADDEQEEIELLMKYFKKLGTEIHEELYIYCFSSGEELMEQYDYSFDLICLDIEMEGTDGIETAKAIRKKDDETLIIFITNMAQMAIRGYEVQAVDFVIKPIKYYSFAMKMYTIFHMINNKKSKNIVVSTHSGFHKISSDKLYYVEVNGHYLFYHTTDGVIKQKGSLTEVEENLSGLSFKRCNNCYLVNLKYVDCVDKDELKVGGEWLKISRPRRKEFLYVLANFIGGVE